MACSKGKNVMNETRKLEFGKQIKSALRLIFQTVMVWYFKPFVDGVGAGRQIFKF